MEGFLPWRRPILRGMPDASATWSSFDVRAEVLQGLEGTRFGDVRVFDEIDSTNRYLMDEARAGAPEGVVAVADHQTAGRGRLDRSWASAPGVSLLVSVLLRPALAPDKLHLVTVVAGLASVDAVADVCGVCPGLKWPNDVVVGDQKLAGLLAETDGVIESPAVVVGMGLNVNWPEFPPDLAGTATACNLLSDQDRAIRRVDLLVAFLRSLDTRLTLLVGEGGQAKTVADYRRACVTLGRSVRVDLPDKAIEGRAVDVDELVRLVVERQTGGRCIVTAGDVVHLRGV